MPSRKKRGWLRKILWGALIAFGVLVVAVGIWFFILDRQVTKTFEGRRWTLPAQVFAAPLELYAGLALSGPQLEEELVRLQYREVDRLDRPGTYRQQGSRYEVALRAARFADEKRDSQILVINVAGNAISGLADSKGQEVAIARFEPMLIGSIFPSHGEDRIVLTPAEVPPLLPAALKAVEDRKFDTHHGVDPTAIARAIWANLRAGGIAQGR